MPNRSAADVLSEQSRLVTGMTTAQRVAEVVRSAILAGELQRGAPVTESTIHASLGVSRNTAREALRLLVGEGLISQERHHSPVVTVIGPEDVADVFAVRTMLEHAAADMIARTQHCDFRPMERAVDRLSRLVGTKDDPDILEADREFHAALISAAGSPRLSAMYARLEPEIRLCLSISTRAHADVQELVDQHAHLLELLESQETAEFKVYLAKHLGIAVDRVTEALRAGHGSSSGSNDRM